MKRDDYLADTDVAGFVQWAGIWCVANGGWTILQRHRRDPAFRCSTLYRRLRGLSLAKLRLMQKAQMPPYTSGSMITASILRAVQVDDRRNSPSPRGGITNVSICWLPLHWGRYVPGASCNSTSEST